MNEYKRLLTIFLQCNVTCNLTIFVEKIKISDSESNWLCKMFGCWIYYILDIVTEDVGICIQLLDCCGMAVAKFIICRNHQRNIRPKKKNM